MARNLPCCAALLRNVYVSRGPSGCVDLPVPRFHIAASSADAPAETSVACEVQAPKEGDFDQVQGGKRMQGGKMKRTTHVLLVGAVLSALLAGASSASAAKTVCAKGCAFTEIQAAINVAPNGATITIGPGAYDENIVVSKSVTL